ncbi:MAG: hypothetical protein GF331_21275 [Chitinivibrionales bacterium]|nr:hypothetical protein [Chitinivibrionales bacterium]
MLSPDLLRWPSRPLIALMLCLPLQAANDTESTATLPLAEILRLHAAVDSVRVTTPPNPPVAASVARIEMVGQLLEDALDVKVDVRLSVLADEQWVEVPLLEDSPGLSVLDAPLVGKGALVRKDGFLSLVAYGQRDHSFSITLRKQGSVKGKTRAVSLTPGPATVAVLRLSYDRSLFDVSSPSMTPTTDGITVYPDKGRFALSWTRTRAVAERPRKTPERPPVDPVIVSAHSSTVSTLEGQLTTRILYELRLEGEQAVSFVVPRGSELRRVYLNKAPITVERSGDSITVTARPARAGELTGTIELVLQRSLGTYNLSGVLAFEAPLVSWPIEQMYVDLHLPEVFTYAQRGGSLSRVEVSPDAEFSYATPLPGRQLSFHQYLISESRPTLVLEYAVDLDGKYYMAER